MPLSVKGLETALAQPGIEVVSVTGGRGETTSWQDGPLRDVAHAAGIPLLAFREVRRYFPQLDLAISFSNPIVFPSSFLTSVGLGVVNMHPAPLPAYRGCHGIEHAILNGDDRFGATLHYCTPEVDTGPIIEVLWTSIDAHDVASDIWQRVDDLAMELLRRNLPRIVQTGQRGERLSAISQDAERSRYYDDLSLPEEAELDLGRSWEENVRWVRAYQHPRRRPAYIVSQGRRILLRYERGRVCVEKVEP
jgi:methionyl-tRNA formyltransferase